MWNPNLDILEASPNVTLKSVSSSKDYQTTMAATVWFWIATIGFDPFLKCLFSLFSKWRHSLWGLEDTIESSSQTQHQTTPQEQ